MKYAMTTSIILHAALLLLAMHIFKSEHDQYYGVTTHEHVPTFLNSTLVNQPTMDRQQNVKKQELINDKIKTTSKALPLSHPAKKLNLQTNTQDAEKNVTFQTKRLSNNHPMHKLTFAEKRWVGEGETQSRLILLIHQAIEKYKSYPMNALQLEREGQVSVSFLLFPNGRIENLKIEQTSGTQELDEAALKAVTLATPFADVRPYLKTPKLFKIKVDFELTDN